MDKRGSLTLLRSGIKDKGARFILCQFKPDHARSLVPHLPAQIQGTRANLRVTRL